MQSIPSCGCPEKLGMEPNHLFMFYSNNILENMMQNGVLYEVWFRNLFNLCDDEGLWRKLIK